MLSQLIRHVQVKKRQPSQYPGEALSPSSTSGDAASVYHTPRPFHIANLRLEVESEGERYVATRLRRTAVSWDRQQKRFHWKRFGLVPALAAKEGSGGGESKGWVNIPWPQEEVVAPTDGGEASRSRRSLPGFLAVSDPLFSLLPNAGELDAPATISLSTTWSPSLASLSLHPAPSTSLRSSPTKAIRSPVPELNISPIDLSGGYHSRANRTKRFNEAKKEQKLAAKGAAKAARGERSARREAAAGEVELA